ncbi:hypothetical protein AQ611_07160 [Burkholderia singularis]|nr:hypothetical protein AQ611_07160 [Burkholderia sp. Bp7605]
MDGKPRRVVSDGTVAKEGGQGGATAIACGGAAWAAPRRTMRRRRQRDRMAGLGDLSRRRRATAACIDCEQRQQATAASNGKMPAERCGKTRPSRSTPTVRTGCAPETQCGDAYGSVRRRD